MYANQSFSKAEVEKLCDSYMVQLQEAEKQLERHFNHVEATNSWWQKLVDLSDDRKFAFDKLARYRTQATELRYFAKANTGTLTPSSVLLDVDTYAKITRCSAAICVDIINSC